MPCCTILCGNELLLAKDWHSNNLRIDMDNVWFVTVTSPKSKAKSSRYCVAQTNMLMNDYIHFQNVGFKISWHIAQTICPSSRSHLYGQRLRMLKYGMLQSQLPHSYYFTTCILVLKFVNKGVFLEEIQDSHFPRKKGVFWYSPPWIWRKRD